MTNPERQQLFKFFLDTFGMENEMIMTIEEMSELTKELCKYRRKDFHKGKELPGRAEIEGHIREEIADVYNCIDQLREIFGAEEIDKIRDAKLKRGYERTIAVRGK
jgi:uncharacterized glyoxalase superfamily protein PhnB